MALGVEEAIALLIRDGDPARLIDGLDTLESFRLYDDPDATKRRIYVGEEPPEPDEIVTIFVEGGGPPIGGGDPNPVAWRPAFTVRTRSTRYERAQDLIHKARAILDYYQGTSNGVPFFRIFANTEPVPLGRDRDDEGGRFFFSQGFSTVTRRFALS